MDEHEADTISVAIILGDRFDDLDFFPMFALLRKSEDYVSLRIQMLSSTPQAVSKCGIQVDCAIPDTSSRFDLIAVPGAANFVSLASCPCFAELMRRHTSDNRPVYTVCSAVDLLQQFGLVDGFEVSAHSRRMSTPASSFRYSTAGVSRDRWLTSVGGDGTRRYLKSVECYYRILEDHFPEVWEAIAARAEIDTVFPRKTGALT